MAHVAHRLLCPLIVHSTDDLAALLRAVRRRPSKHLALTNGTRAERKYPAKGVVVSADRKAECRLEHCPPRIAEARRTRMRIRAGLDLRGHVDGQVTRGKKSTSYRQTFRQHRLLLSAPILLAVLIAAALVLSGGKSYESSASLWVDSPATTDSTLGNLNPALTPPSTQEQNVVTELLATPGFDDAVAHHSLLASYLANSSSGGLSSLLGGGGGSLEAKIIAALGPKSVTTTVPGPQVLQISYVGPTPAVAQSVLKAIVTQLQNDSSQFSQQHNRAALDYYEGQVQTAAQTLLAARNQAEAYRNSHPGAAPNDPNLAALTTAETSAGAELSQAQAGLSAAKSTLKGGTSSNQVQVIDAPSAPVGPTSGKKKQAEGILAGLLAGLVISFLGTMALTRRERDPWEDEVAEGAGTPAAAAAAGAPAWVGAPGPAVYAAPPGFQLVPAAAAPAAADSAPTAPATPPAAPSAPAADAPPPPPPPAEAGDPAAVSLSREALRTPLFRRGALTQVILSAEQPDMAAPQKVS